MVCTKIERMLPMLNKLVEEQMNMFLNQEL